MARRRQKKKLFFCASLLFLFRGPFVVDLFIFFVREVMSAFGVCWW